MFCGDYYDRKLWMIITSDSLRQLQETACHKYFKTCVRELPILPILFDDHRLMSRSLYPLLRHDRSIDQF